MADPIFITIVIILIFALTLVVITFSLWDVITQKLSEYKFIEEILLGIKASQTNFCAKMTAPTSFPYPGYQTSYSKDLASFLCELNFITPWGNCTQTPPQINLTDMSGNTIFTTRKNYSLSTGQFVGTSYINGNDYILAFTGSVTEDQWKSDFDMKLVSVSWATGLVHQGFSNIVNELGSTISADMTSSGCTNFVITGHSLGGAVATLMSVYLNKPYILYSFASPRVGNQDFTAWFNTLGLINYRIYNTEDLIPQFPLPLHYEHVSPGLPFTAGLGNIGDNHTAAYIGSNMP